MGPRLALPTRAMKQIRVALSDNVKSVKMAKDRLKRHVKEQLSLLENKFYIGSSRIKDTWFA